MPQGGIGPEEEITWLRATALIDVQAGQLAYDVRTQRRIAASARGITGESLQA